MVLQVPMCSTLLLLQEKKKRNTSNTFALFYFANKYLCIAKYQHSLNFLYTLHLVFHKYDLTGHEWTEVKHFFMGLFRSQSHSIPYRLFLREDSTAAWVPSVGTHESDHFSVYFPIFNICSSGWVQFPVSEATLGFKSALYRSCQILFLK